MLKMFWITSDQNVKALNDLSKQKSISKKSYKVSCFLMMENKL